MNRKKLKALIALNIALLIGIVLTTITMPQAAQAQGFGGQQYIMVAGPTTGRSQQDVVYIIELGTARTAAVFFVGQDKSFQVIAGADIMKDLRR